jgi:hypothetical protein
MKAAYIDLTAFAKAFEASVQSNVVTQCWQCL